MTKVTTIVDVSAFTTDAKFRAWGSANSAALAAAGFVQTADTGQIDWLTVLKPVAASTTAGYEVWRFNDALQGADPIFIKISYGSGGVAGGNSPAITQFQVGTGSNGTGTLTGPTLSTGNLNAATAVPINTGMVCQATHSLANGYGLMNFGLALAAASGVNASGSAGLVMIQRSVNSSGAPTGDGVSVAYGSTNAGSSVAWSERSINFNTGTVLATSTLLIGPLQTAVSLSTASTTALFRKYTNLGTPDGLKHATSAVAYSILDPIASGSEFPAAAVGPTSRNYYAWSPTGARGFEAQASANIGGAWLWED